MSVIDDGTKVPEVHAASVFRVEVGGNITSEIMSPSP
jgi:hypothetical protein